jgi:hypothetical protein
MVMNLLTDVVGDTGSRMTLSGLNYQGRHRSPHFLSICRPGSLVLEPDGPTPCSVIRQIDAVTALVRHVGTCDDHPARIEDLTPFADGARVRLGRDFSASG